MKLDVSKFKKISSDENSTVMRHEAGHEFRISHKALTPEIKKQLNKIPQYFEDGGEVSPPVADEKEDELGIPGASVSTELAMEGRSAAKEAMHEAAVAAMREDGAPASAAPAAAPTQMASTGPAPASLAPAALDPQSPAAPASSDATAMGAIQKQKSGIQAEAKALGDLGKVEANIAQQEIDNTQKVMADSKANFDTYLAEGKNLIADYEAGHIKPNQYMENMSAGKRVSTAIGMILSGIGSGLTGQENMAMKFLNEQINRDIEGQKAAMGKIENLYTFNMKQFGNARDASDMALAMQRGIYAAKLKQAAGMAQDPLAKARALKAAGDLEMSAVPLLQKTAERQAAMKAMKGGGGSIAQAVNVVVPEAQRNEALKELGEYSTIQSNIKQVDKVMMDAFSNVGVGENLKNPIQAKQRRDVAFAQLFPIVKAIVGEKMTKDDAESMVKPFLPGFTTSKETLSENIKKLKQQLITQSTGRTPILNSYGLIPEQTASARSPQEERLYNFAKANPKSQQAQLILQRLGEK